MKTCSKCKLVQNESEFRFRKENAGSLRSWCKSCDKAYHDRYQRPASGVAKNLRQSLDYAKTLNGKMAKKRYRISEKGRIAFQQAARRRRERRRNLDSQFTNQDAKLIFERFCYQCFRCASTDRLVIDHHYPLSRGYVLSLNNAVLLCRSCNSRKHNKMPESFYSPEELTRLTRMLV